ncbi:MAG: TonB family protein [Candidatus Sulfotelmatobacter sp.]
MSYQALLFCPDEKTARTLTQVLSELDFTVTPCTEPFAAVKKLMGEHFDAVVVDCDNEQNATLLFKSARNSPNNQSALAVAVVEAQAGVAKAFRIGANLVLTKPINVEQAKGTLRVARGLLRKGETVKPGTTTTIPAPKAAESSVPFVKAAAVSGPGRASGAAQKPISQPSASASIAKEASETGKKVLEARAESTPAPVAKTPAQLSTSKTQSTPPAARVGTGTASAPAPAREPNVVEPAPPTSKTAASQPLESKASEPKFSDPKSAVSLDSKPAATASEPPIPVETAAASEVIAPAEATAMPTLTFGGNAGTEAAAAGGGSKKALIGVAAVVLLAAGGYFGWAQWKQMGHSSATTAPAPVAAAPAKSVAAPIASQVVPDNPPATSPAAVAPDQTSTADATPASRPVESNAVSHASKSTAKTEPASTPTVAVASNKVPETKQPMVIKNGAVKNDVSASASDASTAAVAPLSALAINPTANSESLPKLPGASKAPTPVLGTVISQGVSEALLLKKIPPVYPPNALRIRMEGAVQLQATISKKGDVSSVKIVKGNDLLAHAAVEAVRQWKYKPYVLDGAPVECQTQITVDFKLPK